MSTDEKGLDQEAEAVAEAMEDINDGAAESSTAVGEGQAEAEIEEMKRHIEELEHETEKLNELKKEAEKSNAGGGTPVKLDENSIYVGQVDYSTTPNELEAFFKKCGTVNRVTIPINKYSGQPKGFAYVEFVDSASVQSALMLDKSDFKERKLTIHPKRHNEPFKGKGKGRKGKGSWGMKGKGKGRGRGRYHPYAW